MRCGFTTLAIHSFTHKLIMNASNVQGTNAWAMYGGGGGAGMKTK